MPLLTLCALARLIPFDGIDVDLNSAPSFTDIDSDGDQDLVIGKFDGSLKYYENTGTALAAAYTLRTGATSPFNGIGVVFFSTPTFVDVDSDGDQDLVIGDSSGTFNYYENTGTALTAAYTLRTGAANPFDGLDVGINSAPTFSDVDNDGDLDLISGEDGDTLKYYENIGSATAPVYTLRTGAADPFDGIDEDVHSAPSFVDIDNDGDQDLVIGGDFGDLGYYINTSIPTLSNFALRTGAADPFDGIDVAAHSAPSFVDIDNDGDQDLVIGAGLGYLSYYENTGTALAPIYTERTGAANPFDGIDIGGP